MMTVCDEMKELRKMLDEKNIPWHDASDVMSEDKDWPVWICRTHFEYDGLKISVVNGFGTYGGWYGANPGMTEEKNMGLLEIMIEDNEPVGWLKAEDIMKILGEKE
ncbi:MAG: hypothetical protein U0K95_01500 [Eubacterium sp.]|nr:hypothetical protein [Eubacterium sp.]